jgi:hypothetical protein
VSAWDSTSRTPEGVLDSIVATTRHFGFQGDEFLGDQISFVYIMGKEHQRFFLEEHWSKEQMQDYMFPRLTAPTSAAQDRYVNIQHPENVLLVAAGGAGMAETWILCPHLAWAITKPVERAAT